MIKEFIIYSDSNVSFSFILMYVLHFYYAYIGASFGDTDKRVWIPGNFRGITSTETGVPGHGVPCDMDDRNPTHSLWKNKIYASSRSHVSGHLSVNICIIGLCSTHLLRFQLKHMRMQNLICTDSFYAQNW